MIIGALDADVGQAERAGDAGADAHRAAGLDEAGRLLDMHLEEGPQCRGVEMTGAGRQTIGIAAAVGDVRPERAVRVAPRCLQCASWQAAERRPAADVGHLEPHALFGADSHDGEIAGGRDTHPLQGVDRDQSGDHAGGAVEIATMRHRIEVRPHDHPLGVAVPAGPCHVEVGRRIAADAQVQPAGRLLDGQVGPLFARAVRVAGHAVAVETVTAERIEEPRRQGAACGDRCCDLHGSAVSSLPSGASLPQRTATRRLQ